MFILCFNFVICFLLTMQRYGDSIQIPRKIPNSSETCMDKRPPFGQIGEIALILVQKNVWIKNISPRERTGLF